MDVHVHVGGSVSTLYSMYMHTYMTLPVHWVTVNI